MVSKSIKPFPKLTKLPGWAAVQGGASQDPWSCRGPRPPAPLPSGDTQNPRDTRKGAWPEIGAQSLERHRPRRCSPGRRGQADSRERVGGGPSLPTLLARDLEPQVNPLELRVGSLGLRGRTPLPLAPGFPAHTEQRLGLVSWVSAKSPRGRLTVKEQGDGPCMIQTQARGFRLRPAGPARPPC